MAQRRMFSLKVVDTDAFCEMPSSAQNLYFHIGMRADDEGFYAGVKGLMAKIHASIDDLNVLLARSYLLDRGDGVYVVKHWKMNNYLQIDRIKETEYEEKRIGLYTKKDGSYTLKPEKAAIKPVTTEGSTPKCIQNVYIDKNSKGLVESNLDKYNVEETSNNPSLTDLTKNKKENACERKEPSVLLKRLLDNDYLIPQEEWANAERILEELRQTYTFFPVFHAMTEFLSNHPEYGRDLEGNELNKPLGYLKNALLNNMPRDSKQKEQQAEDDLVYKVFGLEEDDDTKEDKPHE